MSAGKFLLFSAIPAFFSLHFGTALPRETGNPREAGLSPPMAVLLEALQEARFVYGPPVEKAFLPAARREFANLLEKRGISPSGAFRAWLGKHPDLARSLYICLDPPDPRIASNLDRLLSELGPKVCDEYANLVFGVAVARRGIGVGPVDLGPRARIRDLLQGKRKRRPRKKKAPSPETGARAVRLLKAFLAEKKWTPLEAYRKKEETLAFLASKGLLPGGNPAKRERSRKRGTPSLPRPNISGISWRSAGLK